MTHEKAVQDVNNVIVSPYFEDLAAEMFCKELSDCMSPEDHVIIVDDGSIKIPFDSAFLSANGLSGQVIRLARNVGHQTAISCGLNVALESVNFKSLIILDSDGEDRPQDISRLVSELNGSKDKADAAVATRKSRMESNAFKIFYRIYQSFFSLLVGRKIQFGNFMALTPRAAKRLAGSHETPMHLAASLINSRLGVNAVSIHRGARYAGKSSMNIVSLTLHGLRSIMVFSETVLVRITLFCALFAGVIIATMVLMVVIKLMGLAIPGWFSIVGGILILLLVQVAIMSLVVLLSAGTLKANPTAAFEYNSLIESIEHVN
jgi:hypothetical protein